MLVGNSHLHLEMGEMQRLSSFLSPSDAHRLGQFQQCQDFRLGQEKISSTCPKTLAVICCIGDKTLKGVFDEDDPSPLHTTYSS